jgi:secreted trypsin-like serine protease
VPGHVGTIAAASHSNPNLPAGFNAVMRASVPAASDACGGYDKTFCVSSPTASLCFGDSGSGFVTIENGRATVTGIASYANITPDDACDVVLSTDQAGLTDVYTYRDWILSTMHTSAGALAGNTRVQASGRAADGTIAIGCSNPYGTMTGSLRAAGVGLGATCDANDTQSVICWLGSHQAAGDAQIAIRSFTMKTTYPNGSVAVTALPFTATSASYYGLLPAGVTREFTCTVNVPRIIVMPPGGFPRIEVATP